MDTGIEATHPDLKNRMSTAGLHRDFTDGSVNGKIVSNPTDPDGHGTHVAGIIGAEGDNSIGTTGVAWDIKLVSLRVFDENGNTLSHNWLINAIYYAADQNISILNYSGSGSENKDDLRQAIAAYSGLFVCAAGNGTNNDGVGKDNDKNSPNYPSNYRLPNLISVGSTNIDDFRSSFSNWGADTVDIFAPGEAILSTYRYSSYYPVDPDDGWRHVAPGYFIADGTSMATPFVTGVAALVLSANPNLTAAELRTVILNNAETITIAVSGGTQNVKRLNAAEAVKNSVFNTRDLSDTTIEITGAKFTLQDKMIIPETIGGKTVTSIANNAFAGQNAWTETIIPTNVENIGDSAFANCTNLNTVTLEGLSRLNSIGSGAFSGCTALTAFEIPYSVISVGSNAFLGCTSLNLTWQYNSTAMTAANFKQYLTNVNFFGAVDAIGANVFEGCVKLKTINIPDTVKTIGANAFANCNSLTTVTFGGNSQLKEIGSGTFRECGNLANFTLPNGVTTISGQAFYGCSKLGTTSAGVFNIPKDISVIGTYAFYGYTGITGFNVDSANTNFISQNGVIYSKSENGIGSFLIAYPSGNLATSFTVPDSVTEIAAYAFSNKNLMSVNLNGVKIVRNYNFYNCQSLANVTGSYIDYVEGCSFEGTSFMENFSGDYVYLGNALLKYKGAESDIYISGYYTIRDGAFSNNQNLVSVTIGNSIVNIGSYTFLNCGNLKTVVFEPSDRRVSCGDEPFDVNTNLRIIVPVNLLQEYQANNFWAYYSNNFQVPQSLVSLNPNDGNAVTYINVSYGEEIYLPELERTGYLFSGWYDDSGNFYLPYTLWNSLNSVVNLKAAWIPLYLINFANTGEQIVPESVYAIYGQDMPYARTPQKDGYIFGGYYLNINGEQIYFYFSDMTSAKLWDLNTDITLTPCWTLPTYNIVFIGCDGWVVYEYQDVEHGLTVYAPSSPSNSGFNLAGWYTGPNGTGNKIGAGSSIIVYFNMTYYELLICTVEFDSNDGSAVSPIVVSYLETITMPITLPTVFKGGFKGSWTAGNTSCNFGTPFIVAGNITFTAIWTEKALSESYNPATNAYEIYFYSQLSQLRNFNSSGVTFWLMNNIALSGAWAPISNFYGILDGKGYSISDLCMYPSSGGNYGLFAVNSGTIENLNLWNTFIEISQYYSASGSEVCVGAFAGKNTGTISNCKSDGVSSSHIYSFNYGPNSYMGGIAGHNTYVISNCRNYLKLWGYGNMGGIAGYNDAGVQSCSNYGDITYESQYEYGDKYTRFVNSSEDNRSIGGIVGLQRGYGSRTQNCAVYGNIRYGSINSLGNTNLKPHMGRVIGRMESGNCLYNDMHNNVDTSRLSSSQSIYAGNREVGR